MTSKERMKIAMSGGMPDRVPTMPQICHPHAIRMLGLPFRETILDVLRKPSLMNPLTLRCAREYGVDGFRAFLSWDPVEIVEEGANAYAINEQGRRIGRVDFQGGGGVVPLQEECLVRNDADIEQIDVPSADTLLDTPALSSVREMVEDAGDELFVVGAPGDFTVQGVTVRRGKQQAMQDLIESPDFVHRIMERLMRITTERAIAWVLV